MLWLAAWTIHNATICARMSMRLKVGGHQRPARRGDAAPPARCGRARAQRALPPVRPAAARGGARAGACGSARRSCGPGGAPDAPDATERVERLVAAPLPVTMLLAERPVLEVLVRRAYRDVPFADARATSTSGRPCFTAEVQEEHRSLRVVATAIDAAELPAAAAALAELAVGADAAAGELLVTGEGRLDADALGRALAAARPPPVLERVSVAAAGARGPQQFTFRRVDGGFARSACSAGCTRDLAAAALRAARELRGRRLPSVEDVTSSTAWRATTRRRAVRGACRGARPHADRDASGALPPSPRSSTSWPGASRVSAGARRSGREPPPAGQPRLPLRSGPPSRCRCGADRRRSPAARPHDRGAGPGGGAPVLGSRTRRPARSREMALRFAYQPGAGVTVRVTAAPIEPLSPTDEYAQRVLAARGAAPSTRTSSSRCSPAPGGTSSSTISTRTASSCRSTTAGRQPGRDRGRCRADADREAPGGHRARRPPRRPDEARSARSPSRSAAASCAARSTWPSEMGVPVEWFAVSVRRQDLDGQRHREHGLGRAGRCAGSIDFTQAGGEVNVIVAGINVGAQPYWNAEATMLMHTRGILIMTPDSAMVLTGKQALDYSGGVSAEDNFGIGGYDRIMGPNGQAQYWAPTSPAACEILLRHYDHTYVAPGERFPRRAPTTDPVDRDVRASPHAGVGAASPRSATSSPPSATPSARSRSTSAR